MLNRIILFNEKKKIEWTNPYMNQFTNNNAIVGKSLDELSDQFIPAIKEEKNEIMLTIDTYTFQAKIRHSDRLIYLFDRTEQAKIEKLYHNEQTVIAMIYLDNYDEITQNMEDAKKSQLNSKVTAVLNNWAESYGLYLKRTSQDR